MRIFGLPLFVAMATLFSVALSLQYNDTEKGITSPNNSTLDLSVRDVRTDVTEAKPVTKRRLSKRGHRTQKALNKLGNIRKRGNIIKDFRDKFLRRPPPSSTPPPHLPAAQFAVDLQMENGLYFATVSVGDGKPLHVKAVVDTGATDTAIIIPMRHKLKTDQLNAGEEKITATVVLSLDPYFGASHSFLSPSSLSVDDIRLTTKETTPAMTFGRHPFLQSPHKGERTSDYVAIPVEGILAMSPGDNFFFRSAPTEVFNYVALLPSHSNNNNNPQLHIGKCEAEAFGEMVWHQVVEKSNGWIIGDGRISVNKGEEVLYQGVKSLIDSGIRFIYGPEEQVKGIYTRLGGRRKTEKGKFYIACNKGHTVSFGWGAEKTWDIYIATGAFDHESECIGVIQPHPKGDPAQVEPQWRMGTWFLENFHTVFRKGADGSNYIGFVELKL